MSTCIVSRMRHARTLQRGLRLCVAALCTGTLGCSLGPTSHPSDADLIQRLDAHEPDFVRLVAMSDGDARVVRIAPDFTRLDDDWNWPRPDSLLGISHRRWDEYRSLFRTLGLDAGLEREQLDSAGAVVIILTASTSGIVGSGSSKGYAYSTRTLSPLYSTLDTLPRPRFAHGVAFRHIRGNWYLEYDW